MEKFIDLTGQKFGKLTVIGKSGRSDSKHRIYWECLCDCGNTVQRRTDGLSVNSMCMNCARKKWSHTGQKGNEKPFHYNVGDVIHCKTDIKILSSFRSNGKKYKYLCLNCGNIDTIPEKDLSKGRGCNVCGNSRKLLVGANDIPSTNPELVCYFQGGYDEAKKYTAHSTKMIDFQCPDCGRIIQKRICDVSRWNSLGCKCSHATSYPEKYVCSMLNQLGIIFSTEKFFKWSGRLRYDFYFSLNNEKTIIEVHGNQHYRGGFNRSSRDERFNDLRKEKLACSNGIDNYIVIDARESNSHYISKNILKSRLNDILNLENVDWLYCDTIAMRNTVKDVCSMYSDGYKVNELAKIFCVSNVTIQHYLHKGHECNWCLYDPHKTVKCKCVSTGVVYDSIKDASNATGVAASSISSCMCGRLKSAGKDQETGERLRWEKVI